MWNHFGDAKSSTAGSYYYDSAEHVNYYFWDMFDQVLIRPELAERFVPIKLRSSLLSRVASLCGQMEDLMPRLIRITFP